ncbi:hypothetical protein SARC_12455 [Sphaeroforma arctica JP610]|uniref:Uncharacterized protein n=1 Tax=Sphaeroforma arctica JP610 TaxID=667725 RepID=A0A0L0FEW6_9EUKA|nr:hypothetical protein SARC_12455 [Sphaeroforma arctica JP610]KNC75011.1 hypothetical protein SARC_12455 [Sphaeroforma arctica JP610]|eukprot:XP_014148913.1 hypothetical protein SARC_12455 [Sphaeroforma arctica JP610]
MTDHDHATQPLLQQVADNEHKLTNFHSSISQQQGVKDATVDPAQRPLVKSLNRFIFGMVLSFAYNLGMLIIHIHTQGKSYFGLIIPSFKYAMLLYLGVQTRRLVINYFEKSGASPEEQLQNAAKAIVMIRTLIMRVGNVAIMTTLIAFVTRVVLKHEDPDVKDFPL